MNDTPRGTATYSPDDNKLRFYPLHRLAAEHYQQIKAAGFAWAPKQELFVAPKWTPAREDLLTEWCGEIEDEDKSLVDRAEVRADRFSGYREKRASEADQQHAAVDQFAERFAFGQPILVGHHSEQRARKDKERIENGMRKAIKLWETSEYWKYRAAGAIRHAKFKELPAVRARRIKTIEAEQRKTQREHDKAAKMLQAWETIAAISDPDQQRKAALHVANVADHYGLTMPDGETHWSAWGAIEDNKVTVAYVIERRHKGMPAIMAQCARWLAHYANRLNYERAMLEEQGAAALLDKKPRKELLPIMNYRAPDGIECGRFNASRDTVRLGQVEVTKAEYSQIGNDYKGCRAVAGTHRVRVAMVRHALVAVYITDSKDHGTPPASKAKDEIPAAEPTPPNEEPRNYTPRQETEERAGKFEALKDGLRQGVKMITAPQLFPTPAALAARVVILAGIEAGAEVLEPSAGTGSLLRALPADETEKPGHVVAIEINRDLADQLDHSGLAGAVVNADFLELTPEIIGLYDIVLMNPPFENAADIKHIQHARAFLKPGGRIVAICANGPRQRRELMDMATHWEDLPAGSFAASGTQVNAALLVIDV
nr:DUF3560 domain-containing protein [uncultured Dongia sp.]